MLKFLYRLALNIVIFCGSFLLQLVGAILLLPLCLFYKIGQLPRITRYFDSADPHVGRDTSTIDLLNSTPEKTPYFIYSAYLTRYVWLAWRNPTNYFNYKVLGFQFRGDEGYTIAGSLDVGDSTGKEQGYKHIELTNGRYEYLYVKRIGASACFYYRMGYKIGDMSNKAGSYCQQVFTISYRSYSGK